jgi:hypothetical protein
MAGGDRTVPDWTLILGHHGRVLGRLEPDGREEAEDGCE